MRKLSMRADTSFSLDLLMRTRTWFLQEIGSMILNDGHVAKPTSRSPKPVEAFGRLWKKRVRPAISIFWRKQRNTQNGSCAAGRRLLKLNLVMG